MPWTAYGHRMSRHVQDVRLTSVSCHGQRTVTEWVDMCRTYVWRQCNAMDSVRSQNESTCAGRTSDVSVSSQVELMLKWFQLWPVVTIRNCQNTESMTLCSERFQMWPLSSVWFHLCLYFLSLYDSSIFCFVLFVSVCYCTRDVCFGFCYGMV